MLGGIGGWPAPLVHTQDPQVVPLVSSHSGQCINDSNTQCVYAYCVQRGTCQPARAILPVVLVLTTVELVTQLTHVSAC